MMPSGRILTPRLRLRPFADDLSDLDELHAIQSDPEHMRFYPHPFSRDESRDWIERAFVREARDGLTLWAIEDRETGQFLGNCGPVAQVVDGVDEVELGWSVTPHRAGQGIATEAAVAWREYCLGPLGLDHVVSLVRPENVPSRRVAEKIGMTVWKETTHRSQVWKETTHRSQETQGWLQLVYRVDAPVSDHPIASIHSRTTSPIGRPLGAGGIAAIDSGERTPST